MPDNPLMLAKKWWHRVTLQIRTAAVVGKCNREQAIVFVDIDNTLADTWPSLLREWKNDTERLLALPPFLHMVKWVNRLYEQGNCIVLITHRTLKQRKVTEQWLMKAGVKYNHLLITASPAEKVKVIRAFPGNNKTLIDDLSYGHESGKHFIYEEVIRQVRDAGVTYVGKKQIDELNSGKREQLW